MLYELQEAQRALLGPVSEWAAAMSRLYSNPYSPFSHLPLAVRTSAGFELLHRLGKEYDKPAWGLPSTTVDGHEVTVVERIEVAKPFCKLIKFERLFPRALASRPADPPVLLVTPLSGNHATLLRDTVRALLPDHDVWVTDWVDARLVPVAAGPFHLDDYVAYVIEFLRVLGPGVHVMAVCQPTVPVLAAVSLMSTLGDPCVPRSMTLMGGPIDTRKSPTKVNDLATTRSYGWFRDNLIHAVPKNHPGAGRPVYPGFLQHMGFVAMNPNRHVDSHWDFFQDLVRGDHDDAEAHRRFYDEYNAVLDMPAEYYLETVKTVFQDHALPKGCWDVRFEGRTMRVTPEDIVAPALLTVEGELDDITGRGQTEAAHTLCSSIPAERRHQYVADGVGHVGIFSGRRWREEIYPRVREHIRGA
jgi:poly(3-hydroxybutyrate) depolymerase